MSKVPVLFSACLALGALAAPAALARPALLTTVNVTAGKPTEFHFILSKVTAKRGIIVFKITNKGAIPHDFKFCSKASSSAAATSCTGRSTKLINPGSSATLRVTVVLKGSYEYMCTVPGHAAGGMRGLFKVT
jgi:uncharacterized cupredoxin-like copper-binding protein